jgi:hypothetical protein
MGHFIPHPLTDHLLPLQDKVGNVTRILKDANPSIPYPTDS